jgi:hypothetical protein
MIKRVKAKYNDKTELFTFSIESMQMLRQGCQYTGVLAHIPREQYKQQQQ